MSRKCVYHSLTRVHSTRMVSAKVYRDSETSEFVARLYVNGKLYEPADSFDSDMESAIGTADMMVGHMTDATPLFADTAGRGSFSV